VYNNNQQKLSLPRYGGLQCPSGYLCPSRVDNEQGEKKQEMKTQGDKNFKKEKRKSCALEHGVWRLEERKRSFDSEFWLRAR
jgi:hypothetical protein